jgi:hypothetical protein
LGEKQKPVDRCSSAARSDPPACRRGRAQLPTPIAPHFLSRRLLNDRILVLIFSYKLPEVPVWSWPRFWGVLLCEETARVEVEAEEVVPRRFRLVEPGSSSTAETEIPVDLELVRIWLKLHTFVSAT